MQNEELRTAQIQAQEAADKYTDLFDFAPLAYSQLTQDAVNRVRQLGFEPGLAAASTRAKPRSPTPVPRGRGGSGLTTPETETAEQCPGPDRFKTNSGVERPPFRFVTAFVTWRPKSPSWPETHGSEGRGIEPAFRFRSAFGDGSWKNQGSIEGLFEALPDILLLGRPGDQSLHDLRYEEQHDGSA